MMTALSRLRRPAPWLAAAGVVVLAFVLWRARGPAKPEVYPPARVLKFPEDFETGRLILRPVIGGEYSFSAEPATLEPALGEIPVPGGISATLSLSFMRSPFDFSFLRGFERDDLQGLSFTGFTKSPPVGLHHITRLSGLRYLRLCSVDIEDGDLKHLRALERLDQLEIVATRVTDEGLKHLSELDQLATLIITSEHVTESGLNRLRAALPNCTINGVKGLPKLENRRPIG